MKVPEITDQFATQLAAFFDRPLIWLLPFYMAGLYQGWQGCASEALPRLALALTLSIFYLLIRKNFHQRQWFVILLAISVFFLGWGLCAKSLAKPQAPWHILNMTEKIGERQIILGGVVSEGSGGRAGSNYRLMIEASEIITPGPDGPLRVESTSGLVRLSVGAEAMEIEAGDYLRLPVILRPINGFKNPGAQNYEKYWGAQGVWVGGFVKSPALVSSWPGTSGVISSWRTKAASFINEKTSPAAVGILSAQLAGRRAAVSLESENVFRALGLSHLLSVSGLHLGVCYALAFWLLRLGLKSLPSLRSHKKAGVRKIRVNALAASLALGPTMLYALLVGSASPVVRAAVSICAVILASSILRRSDPWNILAAAAWLLLLLEPYRLFTVSFQLSFVATAAMLAVFIRRPGTEKQKTIVASNIWSRPISGDLWADLRDRLKNRGQPGEAERLRELGGTYHPGRRESFIKKTFLAALAGSVGTAPLVAWHFSWVPLAAIPANMIFTPILTFFVLIPGLLAMLLLPLSPTLAAWPMEFAGTVLTALLPLMEQAAKISSPGLLFPAPGPWFLAAFYLAGWIWLRSARPLKKRFSAAALILALGLLPGLLSGPGQKGVLRFTVLDVGQGSAVHINFPDGQQMLVDGGGTKNFDPGERIIGPYLSRQGLRRLDVLALTHPDQDHLKGLVHISKYFRPYEIWDAPWPKDYSPLYQEFLEASPESIRQPLGEIHNGRTFGQAEVKILWPPIDYKWAEKSPNASWSNDSSLVFKISWGGGSFLITGDISQKIERDLVERYGPALESTVLMAPHHGSRNSLSPEFLAAVKPRFVVFSAGRNNFFGLPSPEAIMRAELYGAEIWRTDLSGAAVFEAKEKGNKVEVELIRWGDSDCR